MSLDSVRFNLTPERTPRVFVVQLWEAILHEITIESLMGAESTVQTLTAGPVATLARLRTLPEAL